MVESQPSKLLVAGSIPVSRSRIEALKDGRKTMAQPQFQVDRTTALYERPAMDIVDATTFAEVKQAIASAFAPASVDKFLKSVERAGVRIREL